MTETDARRVGRALWFAVRAHAGERDKGGAPYALHPVDVGMALCPHPVGMMAGFLHDVTASGRITLMTVEVAYGRDVREAMAAMLPRNGEPYLEHVGRAAQHPVARTVLLACVTHHLFGGTYFPDDVELQRYRRALEILKEEPA